MNRRYYIPKHPVVWGPNFQTRTQFPNTYQFNPYTGYNSSQYAGAPLGDNIFGLGGSTGASTSAANPNVVDADFTAKTAATTAPGIFARARAMFGNGKTIGPNLGNFGDLNGFVKDFQNTNLLGLGKIKNISQAGLGLYQGGRAVKGLIDNSKKDTDINSLKNDISTAVASNPMYDMYLDAADEKTLRQMQNGGLTNGAGGAAEGVVKGIPQALLAALLGGVTGGWGGAAINGVGSLINSGIRGYGNEMDEASGKLQGLYSKLRQAQSEYKTMKRPRGLGSAGLQTQYFNQLY